METFMLPTIANQEPPSVYAVDREAPVVGLRAWQMCSAPVTDGLLATRLDGGFNGPMLVAGDSTAECGASDQHDCPDPSWSDVNCGIPICDPLPPAALSPDAEPKPIRGLMLGWGRTIEGESGIWRWRTKHARLVALAIAPELRRVDPERFVHRPSPEQLAELPDPTAYERPTRFPVVSPSVRHGSRCDPEWAVRLAHRYAVPLFERIEELHEFAASVPQRL
jgi:hypothetical protein